MAEYEVDFGFGMTQKFGKRPPTPGSLADAMPGMSSPATSPMTATTGGSPAAPSGYISDMADPDRYVKMADSLRRDWLSRTAPTGSVNGGMALGGSGRLPSPVPTVSSYGNDMTEANRMNAGANVMKRSRLGTPAPGSLAGSLAGNLTVNRPTERTDNRTWGDLNQMPAFRQVGNVGAMGGNF